MSMRADALRRVGLSASKQSLASMAPTSDDVLLLQESFSDREQGAFSDAVTAMTPDEKEQDRPTPTRRSSGGVSPKRRPTVGPKAQVESPKVHRASLQGMTRQSSLFDTIVKSKDTSESAKESRMSVVCEAGMISPENPVRVFWDVSMMIFVVYVAISLPYYVAFVPQGRPTQRGFMAIFEFIVDACFILDVFINFRTGFRTSSHAPITYDWRLAGKRYLQSWFAIDLISSFPLTWILNAGGSSSLTAVKLLRIGRLSKAAKMLRLGRLVKLYRDSPLSYAMEEHFISSTIVNLGKVFTGCVLIAHYIACFKALSSGIFLEHYEVKLKGGCEEEYSEVHLSLVESECLTSAADWNPARRYLAALYWAVTTMTTVGYGDIVPHSDTERAVAIVAMLVGGGFYGYVIGIMATLVATSDANSRAISAKMDIVNAWLSFNDLPPRLKRKVRIYFKSFLHDRSALDEQAILNDLDPGLRAELGRYLTPQVVRDSLLFGDLEPEFLSKLTSMLRPVPAAAGDTLQVRGTVGSVMHVIVAGDVALVYRNFDNEEDEEDDSYEALQHQEVPRIECGAGDTFGDLVALSVEKTYDATAVVMSPSALYVVERNALSRGFSALPEVLNRLRQQAMETRDYNKRELGDGGMTAVESKKRQVKNLRSTLIGGGGATLPTGFADTMLEALGDIQQQLESNNERWERREEREAAKEHARWLERQSELLEMDADDWLEIFGGISETWGLCCVVSDMQPADGSRTCPMVSVNSAFLNCTGYGRREEVLYRNCKFLQGPETEPEAIETLKAAIGKGEDVTCVITNYRKNGDLFKNLLSMRAVYDADDKYRFVIGIQFEIFQDEDLGPKLQQLDKLLKLLPRKLPFKSGTLEERLKKKYVTQDNKLEFFTEEAQPLAAIYEGMVEEGASLSTDTWLRNAKDAMKDVFASRESLAAFGVFLAREKLKGALDFASSSHELLELIDAPMYHKRAHLEHRDQARTLLRDWAARTKLGGDQALYIGATADPSRNAERLWLNEVNAGEGEEGDDPIAALRTEAARVFSILSLEALPRFLAAEKVAAAMHPHGSPGKKTTFSEKLAGRHQSIASLTKHLPPKKTSSSSKGDTMLANAVYQRDRRRCEIGHFTNSGPQRWEEQ